MKKLETDRSDLEKWMAFLEEIISGKTEARLNELELAISELIERNGGN